MGWCLAAPMGDDAAVDAVRATDWLHRFDPAYWTVDFPRPMMAAATTLGPDALRIDASFAARDNLCGLIWDSVDRWDHPLTAYHTNRDYGALTWTFRWRSAGVMPLDAVNGPVLTIEGRDAADVPRVWYVRLWNYAVGTPEDAVVTLDFDALDAGFLIPAEATRVWPHAIDRMFISIVAPDYDGGSAAPYAAMRDGWVELTAMRAGGSGAMLRVGDAHIPPHGRSIATGYDDSYNLTPERLLRQIGALGYTGDILHYVGMSHYPRLARSGPGWAASVTGGAIAPAAAAWHADFAARAAAAGYGIIWSLSYELFAAYCPPEWAQRDAQGNPALTGWVPPSTLLSPANVAAMGYLAIVMRAWVAMAIAADLPVKVQIGEPWWWVTADRRICLYDAAATAALGAASVPLPDLGAVLTPAQTAMLDSAGALLAQSTAALTAAVRDAAGPGGATVHLLAYLPTILSAEMPEAKRANLPVGWAAPAFDVLQLEDYDWASRGQAGASAAGVALATARLGYPPAAQHYLSGFVLRPEERAQWASIDAAADAAAARGAARVFIWALPQVLRDGYVHFSEGDEAMAPFDDVTFPISIGREASVSAQFSTAIVTGQSGAEQRAADWADARLAYDVAPGVRSLADVRALIAFYRARRGPAVGFRFRDPLDHSSAPDNGAPAAGDQAIGTGDGVTTDFALVKQYAGGDAASPRRITRAVAGSVVVAANGAPVASGWTLAPGGVISFTVPPVAGAAMTAGYLFDVAVRFADDRLDVACATHDAIDIASVGLIAVREV